ncbi:MAG: polysaccharide biosynthesis tyrosine autokinase [Acidobacteriia bacterium]|nr:polysaccharide biosynthesis tyrosine autokinase [Terriglobia bacterium]
MAVEKPHTTGRDAPQIDIMEYLRLLNSGKWIILTCTVVIVGIVVVYGLLQPPLFRATAEINIEQPSNVMPTSLSQGQEYAGLLNYQTYMNTQYRILTGRALGLEVARRLIKEKPALYQYQPVDALAIRIAGSVTPTPVPDTSLVAINITSANPQEAALFANVLCEAYVEQNERSIAEEVNKLTSGLTERIQEQSKKLQETGEKASQVARQEGLILTPDGKRTIDDDAVLSATKDLAKATSDRQEIEIKKSTIERAIQANDGAESVPTSMMSPAVQTLVTTRIKLETDLLGLTKQYGPKFPMVLQKEREVEQIRTRINDELRSDLKKSETELSNTRKQEQDAQVALSQARGEANLAAGRRDKLEAVQSQKESQLGAIERLQQSYSQIDLLKGLRGNNISIVERATVPGVPINQQSSKNLFLGLVGGLILGAALTFLRDFIDNTIKTHDDVEAYLDIPQLAVIPRSRNFDSGMVRESFNTLRTALLFARRDRNSQAILITSALPQEGKSTVSLHLAEALADAGDPTLLIDLDLRRPSLHRQLKTPSEPGFTNLMTDAEMVNLNRIIRRTGRPNLSVITAGALPPNVPAFLAEGFIDYWLDQFRSMFRWVLIDSPPVASVSDPLILTSFVEGVVFVCRAHATDKKIARRCVQKLQKVNPHVVGAVLNDYDLEKVRYYEYQYYYQYYSSKDPSLVGDHREDPQ